MKMSDTAHEKSVSFATLPPHLSILVNAQWDPYTGNSFRSAQRWTYPGNIEIEKSKVLILLLEFLELSKFCYTTKLRGVPTSQKSYELQAVVVHIGTGNCGHYVTTRKVNDAWYQVKTCWLLDKWITFLELIDNFDFFGIFSCLDNRTTL